MGSKTEKFKRALWPKRFQEGYPEVDHSLQQLAEMNFLAEVEEIFILKTRLVSKPDKKRLHHFIIIGARLHCHDGERSERILIRAEKDSTKFPGGPTIRITLVPDSRLLEGDLVRYKALNLSVIMSMRGLVEILCLHDPAYDILSDNCWTYAYETCQKLFNHFASLQPDNAQLMKKHRQNLPLTIMPAEFIQLGVTGGLVILGLML